MNDKALRMCSLDHESITSYRTKPRRHLPPSHSSPKKRSPKYVSFQEPRDIILPSWTGSWLQQDSLTSSWFAFCKMGLVCGWGRWCVDSNTSIEIPLRHSTTVAVLWLDTILHAKDGGKYSFSHCICLDGFEGFKNWKQKGKSLHF